MLKFEKKIAFLFCEWKKVCIFVALSKKMTLMKYTFFYKNIFGEICRTGECYTKAFARDNALVELDFMALIECVRLDINNNNEEWRCDYWMPMYKETALDLLVRRGIEI